MNAFKILAIALLVFGGLERLGFAEEGDSIPVFTPPGEIPQEPNPPTPDPVPPLEKVVDKSYFIPALAIIGFDFLLKLGHLLREETVKSSGSL